MAVLPFENLSRADDGDVLALGIAEAVLHQLANLAQLEVISRTSSFSFRDSTEDAREIGEKLGARYLLEGSVQSDRTRMRVTTQLIDTQSGADVWSMRFDRPPGDVFAVQDEIAMQVARALELSLDANAKDRLTGQGTSNLDAYLAFLQGRSLLANDRVVDMREAIAQFERSIDARPEVRGGVREPRGGGAVRRRVRRHGRSRDAVRPRARCTDASWSTRRWSSIPRTAMPTCSARTSPRTTTCRRRKPTTGAASS